MNRQPSTNNTGPKRRLMKAAHIIHKVKSLLQKKMITPLVQFVVEQSYDKVSSWHHFYTTSFKKLVIAVGQNQWTQ